VFERYTEKARRVVFFGVRSQPIRVSPSSRRAHIVRYSSRVSELTQLLPSGAADAIRKQIETTRQFAKACPRQLTYP